MPFPLSLSGTVDVRDVGTERAIERLESALERSKGAAIRREGSAIRFRGPSVFRGSGSNVLGPISSGVLEVSPTVNGVRVRYRISFGRMLAMVTFMVAVFLGPFMMSAPNVSVPGGLGLLSLCWLWLFGGNFVITRIRFPPFLVRSISPTEPPAGALQSRRDRAERSRTAPGAP